MHRLIPRSNTPPWRRLGAAGAIAIAAGAIALTHGPGLFAAAVPATKPSDTSSAPAAEEAAAATLALPKPLGEADAQRYGMIFKSQEQGLWPSADRQIRKLADPSLMGHVLAQRYLHPTAYRSTYRELVRWLEEYSDLPEARDIHALALLKKPRNAKAPPSPPAAVELAGAPENHVTEPSADWLAGLTAWKEGEFGPAAMKFEKVARSSESPPWDKAAGAFWAARSHLKDRQPAEVSKWLKVAARYRESFYGQISRRMLGLDPGFDFSLRPFDAAEAKAIVLTPAGSRALGLLQVGQTHWAEKELLTLQARRGNELGDAMAALAQMANMPALALNVAAGVEDRKLAPWLDAMRYPMPAWKPADGFLVDRALLYAIMRHESGFDPDANSGAGAKGLMQIMPATADAIVRKKGFFSGAREHRLLDPVTNLTLGQKYIRILFDDSAVKGSLIGTIASYNAGPGNYGAWKSELKIDDPLLFIESIPSLQTRTFVRRVLASLWIYRERLGQDTPALDALVAGEWPIYQPMDATDGTRVARYGTH
jgi:soluble lytic murein transglycosylase-like protein